MVLASHVICTAYGFWLPNAQSGSWSDFVRSWELFLHGRATKVDSTRSVAREPFDRAKRKRAIGALKHDPVEFSGVQALCIARGFSRAIDESGYRVLACSILPKHTHLVIERHAYPVERIAGHLKTRATQELVAAGLHPFVGLKGADGRFPSVWAHRPWKVFLDAAGWIDRAIDYVEQNPVKAGLKRQFWKFVVPYGGESR